MSNDTVNAVQPSETEAASVPSKLDSNKELVQQEGASEENGMDAEALVLEAAADPHANGLAESEAKRRDEPEETTTADVITNGDGLDAPPDASVAAEEVVSKDVAMPEEQSEEHPVETEAPASIECDATAGHSTLDVKPAGSASALPTVSASEGKDPPESDTPKPPAGEAVTPAGVELQSSVSVKELQSRLIAASPPPSPDPRKTGPPSSAPPAPISPRTSASHALGSAAVVPAAPALTSLSSGGAPLPVPPRSPLVAVPKVPVVPHDLQNTVNASQLLQLGAFKYTPLKDVLPLEQLLTMRLEDGIDATRREDYLGDDDFKSAFAMDRDAFRKMPAWKQQLAKKKANLF